MSITFAGNPNEARRRASSKAQILAACKAAGPTGCTNAELNAISFRYGGRIHELRQQGHVIESVDEHDGAWRFILRPSPQPGSPGYLASLPAVNPTRVVLVDPGVPAATGDRLF